MFDIFLKFFKSLSFETLLVLFFAVFTSYWLGYYVGEFEKSAKIKQEIIQKENDFKKEILKKTEEYNKDLSAIEKKYLAEINNLRKEHEEVINKINLNNLNLPSVRCLYDNQLSELRESANTNKCNIICIKQQELLQRIERSLVIARDCEEEHKKLKSLLENCNLNVKFR